MDETIGLGFSSQYGGVVGGATSFVPGSIIDAKDENNVSDSRGNIDGENEAATNHSAASNSLTISRGSMQENGGFTDAQRSRIFQQQQQPLVPPWPQPNTIQQPMHSQLHIQPQLHHSNMAYGQSTFPHPPPSGIYGQPAHPFLQNSTQPPPIIANSYNPKTEQCPIPSFEPPPGMPPSDTVPSFPHPPDAAPSAPIPPPTDVMTRSRPPPELAQSIPAHIQSQLTQQLMHQDEQKQQLQQQHKCENDSLEKARLIAMRFHQESSQTGGGVDTSIPCNINYAQQRKDHFEKEKRKLQTFNLNNLEYVMKHEEKELRRHVECMNQMTAYEEKQQLQLQLQQQQQRQRQLQLEQKQRQREQVGILNDGGGGIGTKEQRRAERVRKRQHSDHTSGPAKYGNDGCASSWNKPTLRTSLYLKNLPIDGSTTERTLQSLFRLYGRLDRVTMYRHRSTGELKGDGLIVFGRDAAEEYEVKNAGGVDLVDAICTQMNGAELPCGTVIGVQPADMDYKKKPKKEEQTQQQSATNGEHYVKHINGTAIDAKLAALPGAPNGSEVKNGKDAAVADDDDLDDFFASL